MSLAYAVRNLLNPYTMPLLCSLLCKVKNKVKADFRIGVKVIIRDELFVDSTT